MDGRSYRGTGPSGGYDTGGYGTSDPGGEQQPRRDGERIVATLGEE